MAGNRTGDPSGGFDGLEGVSDDELERAASGTFGDRSGQSQSATPQQADPAGSTIEGEDGGGPAKPSLLQMLGYDSEEVAAESVKSLRNWASKTKDEAEVLRDENTRLKAQLGVTPQQVPVGQPADPLSILEKDFFVPREVIGPAVEALVQKQLTSYLAPLVAQQEADKQMAAKYGPEYERVKPHLASFVDANPHVAEMVRLANEKGIPQVGQEYALGAFREAVALATHNGIQDGADAAERAKDRGRNGGAPLQGRENTRARLAKAQSGGTEGIDMMEAVRQANMGNDRLMDEAFGSRLPSEEAMERAMRGH